jgi:hypothetical protein
MLNAPNNVFFIKQADVPGIALRIAARVAGSHKGLARRLNVERTTVYNWAKSRRIPIEPINYAQRCAELTGLPLWFFRPDIYGWPENHAVTTPWGVFALDRGA